MENKVVYISKITIYNDNVIIERLQHEKHTSKGKHLARFNHLIQAEKGAV